MFILLTLFFVLIPQIFVWILNNFFPIVFACAGVEFAFCFFELILSVYVIISFGQKNNALFELRNVQMIRHTNRQEKIKTSQEIEDELYQKKNKSSVIASLTASKTGSHTMCIENKENQNKLVEEDNQLSSKNSESPIRPNEEVTYSRNYDLVKKKMNDKSSTSKEIYVVKYDKFILREKIKAFES